MDHGVNAKVIITLLDLYVFAALFFSLPPVHFANTHLQKKLEVHARRSRKFSQMNELPPGVEFGG